MPPPFSAKKIRGRPAHELARKHKPVELKAVEVEVYEFRLVETQGPAARYVIECGAGTYIRSLAHDLGQLQGSGAHLTEIVRTAVGEFTLDQCVSLEELRQAAQQGRVKDWVIPPERLLPELPSATVLPIIERRVRHGAQFKVQLAQIQPGRITPAEGATSQLDSGDWKPARLRVFNQQQRLIAIAQAVVPRVYQPVVVLDAAP
jgi:tRNA pseudouridine55 synthase